MSYTLNVVSDFYTPLPYYRDNEAGSIHRGMKPSFKKLGRFRLVVPGVGDLTLFDIANRKISNIPFMRETWGVLITYQGVECEHRYEGEGEINVNVTEFGQIELSGKGDFIVFDMPSFSIKRGSRSLIATTSGASKKRSASKKRGASKKRSASKKRGGRK